MNIHLPRLLVIELIIIATGIIAYFAGNIVGRFGHVALIFALAILLTYALLPIVNWLHRWIPRGLAIFLTYLGMLAAVTIFAVIVSAPITKQVEQLAKDYPQYRQQLEQNVPKAQQQLHDRGVDVDLKSQVNQLSDGLKDQSVDVAKKSGSILASLFGTVSTVFIVLFVSIYFLLSGDKFVESLISLTPRNRHRLLRKLAKDYDHILGSFVRGHLLLSVIVGTVVTLFSELIGLPYSALIGLVAAITSLIPVIGAFLGVILPVIIAAFVHPLLIPVFLAFFIILNEISDKVLYPRIVGKAVNLHPLIILFGLLIGLKLAGIAGALLAAPVLALVRTTAIAIRNSSGYMRV